MHVAQLVDLAGVVTAHAPALIGGRTPPPTTALREYWRAATVRLQRWHEQLRQATPFVPRSPQQAPALPADWSRTRLAIQEILISEILARVWAAVVVCWERRHSQADADPIVRGVMLAHAETRTRALRLLVHAQGVRVQDAVGVNRLWRRCQRWTDLLIGHLATRYPVVEFAADPHRAREFAHDLRARPAATAPTSDRLMWVSLTGAFRDALLWESPQAELHAAVAESIAACLPGDLFDDLGVPRPLWLDRLQRLADDTESLLDDLWRLETGCTDAGLPPRHIDPRPPLPPTVRPDPDAPAS
jgi:hypothetical protein